MPKPKTPNKSGKITPPKINVTYTNMKKTIKLEDYNQLNKINHI